MAEFKIKKEKFDILLNLIAKTNNEELQNAFLDYQNEKNENNEGYLNYLKSVREGGTSIREKAALPLQNVIHWVAIEHRNHPEQCSEVLVRFKDGNVKCRYFDGDMRFYNVEQDIDITDMITHWAALPK